jgi:hypothetical protein
MVIVKLVFPETVVFLFCLHYRWLEWRYQVYLKAPGAIAFIAIYKVVINVKAVSMTIRFLFL